MFFVIGYDGVSSNKCSTIGALHIGIGKLIYMIMFLLTWSLWANVRCLKALHLLLPCTTMVFSFLLLLKNFCFPVPANIPIFPINQSSYICNLPKTRNLSVTLPTRCIIFKLRETCTKIRFKTLRLVDTQSLEKSSREHLDFQRQSLVHLCYDSTPLYRFLWMLKTHSW